MSKLQKNQGTALIINGEIHVLVREKIPKENGVCYKCSLYYECCIDTDKPRYSGLCIPPSEYEGWFFVRSLLTTEYKAKELVRQINECVDI